VLFTSRYGEEVAGLVLVDASHPAQLARLREATGKSMLPRTTEVAIGSALAWTGIVRLASGGHGPSTWPAIADIVSRAYLPISIEALRRETVAISATLDAAGRVRSLGDRPLVVLTATANSPATLAAEGITQAQADRMQAAKEAGSLTVRHEPRAMKDAPYSPAQYWSAYCSFTSNWFDVKRSWRSRVSGSSVRRLWL
jgi:hypothetical protein